MTNWDDFFLGLFFGVIAVIFGLFIWVKSIDGVTADEYIKQVCDFTFSERKDLEGLGFRDDKKINFALDTGCTLRDRK